MRRLLGGKGGRLTGGPSGDGVERRGTFLEFLEEARPFALGLLGLLPAQFYALTPAEFADLCRGFEDRRRLDDERTAGFVCVIANACGHLKRPLTVEKLIGRRKRGVGPAQEKRMNDLKARGKAFAGRLNEKLKPKEA